MLLPAVFILPLATALVLPVSAPVVMDPSGSESWSGPLPANESGFLPPWPATYSLAKSTLCWGTK